MSVARKITDLQPTIKTKKGHYGNDADIEAIIETACEWIDAHYRQVQDYAAAQSQRHGRETKLGYLFGILAPKPYKRPTHDLLCACRKCEPSIQTYYKRMKQII